MKHLGKIEIGGSLDITNNRHVEDLIEEAIQGIEIPEDTDTTYTLTQDGLTVQLVDDSGQTVSEIEIPKLEDENTTYTLTKDGTTIRLVGSEDGTASEVDLTPLIPQPVDPYQEEKDITVPPANLQYMFSNGAYTHHDFDMSSDFDAENNRISIYLRIYEKGIERKFTIADNVNNFWKILKKSGETSEEIHITEVSTDTENVIITGTDADGADRTIYLFTPKAHSAQDFELDDRRRRYGIIISDVWGSSYFYISGDPYITYSEPTVITATLEEHLRSLYESIHAL